MADVSEIFYSWINLLFSITLTPVNTIGMSQPNVLRTSNFVLSKNRPAAMNQPVFLQGFSYDKGERDS
jgi:hypothetical protein